MVWGSQARTEDEEVDSLRRMFASSGGGHRDAQQDDHLPIGTFMKLLVANENRKGADQVRLEKQQHAELLQRRAEEQVHRVAELKRERGEKDAEALAAKQAEKNRHAP